LTGCIGELPSLGLDAEIAADVGGLGCHGSRFGLRRREDEVCGADRTENLEREHSPRRETVL
jgi:hypothetical protein